MTRASAGRHRGSLVRAVLFLVASLATSLAHAGVPNERAVPAYAEEQTILQLEQGLRAPGLASQASGIEHFDRHYIAPPGLMPEQDVILQRGGNTWRSWRNGPLSTFAAVLILGVPLLILAFYRVVGPAAPGEPDTGRTLVRFTRWQRWIHWASAIVFVLLGLTGLILLYGKKVMLPWMGHDLFSWLAIGSKYVHNVAGPVFVLLSIAMFATFVGLNRFRRDDWRWMKRVGGMFTHEHVPAGFFNAGEKVFFWLAVTALGLLVAVSGLMLDFPYLGRVGEPVGFTRYVLQWAAYVHLGSAVLYLVIVMGHAYLGTLGTPGAWRAMRHGTVDESWAKAHHSLWYDDATRRPQFPAQR